MQVETSCGDGVAEGEELTINYSPGHSGQDPRNQHPPFYFGVFYGEHAKPLGSWECCQELR